MIDGWLLDLDTVRTWTRNPMIYASAITDGVHNLMTMESSPAAERMAKAASKLRRCRGSSRRRARNQGAAARFRRARDRHVPRRARSRRDDLPRAFAGVGDAALQASLKTASADALVAIELYVKELETSVLPRATGSYAIGTAAVEARYWAEELIDAPAARCWPLASGN